jgi:hypothetical protein
MSRRPAGTSERSWVGWKRSSATVVLPARFRLDQRDGRLVAVLGLAADVAHRLVDQHRDALRLLLGAAWRSTVIFWCGSTLLPSSETTWPSTRTQPRDPFVGFAARAQAEFGHAFGEADVVRNLS